MFPWAAAATAAALLVLVFHSAYRRQIRAICRQLAFVLEHQTNLRLRSALPCPELEDLIDGINEVLDSGRESKRRADQTSDALKETIANLSHDIRTPLTSLDGYFQLLARSDSRADSERYIAVIQGRITSLKELLEELFAYTKLQDESFCLSIGRVDLTRLVADIALSFYEDFTRIGIEPSLELPDEPICTDSNAEALRRILQNLLKNALEHGRSQIRLALTAGDPDFIRIVCSNDVDCPEHIDVDRVFTRFYKADTARTKSSSGLGLSIARALAERLGGRLSASLESAETTEDDSGSSRPVDSADSVEDRSADRPETAPGIFYVVLELPRSIGTTRSNFAADSSGKR